MNKKLFILTALTLILPVFIFGGGETGGDVLKVEAGNRASGMAGAYTAAGSGTEAIFYNPGILQFLDILYLKSR